MESFSGLWELHIPSHPDSPEQQGVGFLKKQKFLTVRTWNVWMTQYITISWEVQGLLVLVETIPCPQSHCCGSLNSCVVLNTLQFGRQPYIIASAAMGSFIPQSWKGTKRMVCDAQKIWSLEAVHWCPDIIIPLFVQSFNEKVTTISLYLVSSSPWGLLMALRQIQSLLAFTALGTGFCIRPVGTEAG